MSSNKLVLIPYGISKFASNLVSFSYFKRNLSTKKEVPEPTKTIINHTKTILQNGCITYARNQSYPGENFVNNRAKRYIQTKSVYGVSNFNSVSKTQWNDFVNLLKKIQRSSIEIIFFLSPYHPIVYERFKNDDSFRNIFAVENKIVELGKEMNIEVVGSFNPVFLPKIDSMFIDGMHLTEKGTKWVFENGN